MGERVEQLEIDVLMAFNSAVVTARLYPASAPQVKNSLDRGFKALSAYLNSHDSFSVGQVSGVKVINHKGVEEDVLAGLTNLVVFRQLELLGLPVVFFETGIDQFSFNQIVTVFTAKVEKIKREGGGREFVANQGLVAFFPESLEDCVVDGNVEQEESKVRVKTDAELLAALFNRNENAAVIEQLRQVLHDPQASVELLTAAIGKLLVMLSKRKTVAVTPEFSQMLDRVDTFLIGDSRSEIIRKLSSVLSSSLKIPALGVLLAQKFTSRFGEELYGGILGALDDVRVRDILELYKNYIAKLENSASSPAQLEILQDALQQLSQTNRVQQFVGKERAEEILIRGEVERLKNRLNNSVAAILRGNFSSLSNSEFIRQFPQVVKSFARQDNDTGLTLITILSQKLNAFDGGKQQELATSLILVAQALVAQKKWDWLHPLMDSFIYWIRKATSPDNVLEQMAAVLYIYMVEERRAGLLDRADEILDLFFEIRSGDLSKSPPVKALIGRVQDRSIDRKALPSMLVECLENPNDEQLSKRFARQGPVVARYLIDSLISSEKTEHRLKILDLLAYSGTTLAPIVLERLDEHMDWYGKRNLIKLLSECGDESHAEEVLKYMSHKDLRVQREAFICLGKIGGKRKKKLFLQALAIASETVRIQIIRGLAPLADEEVAAALCGLLKEYTLVKERDVSVIVMLLLRVLASCPFSIVAQTLKEFIDGGRGRGGSRFDEEIWNRADEALVQVEANRVDKKGTKYAQISQLRKASQRQAARLSVNKKKQPLITGFPEEQYIRELFDCGREEKAAEELLKLIERLAHARNFGRADRLRKWMIEVAPSMLTEIIRAAEIIEEEKTTSIDKGHIEIWSDLYDLLTTEEFATLYHYLKHKTLSHDQVIVNQGADQKSLFFINSGSIRLYYHQNGSDVLIKTLGKGSVLGAGAFFDATVWTVSASSVGHATVSILNLEDISSWADEYPALEPKLQDFCYKFEKVDDFFKKSSRDRREYERITVEGRLTAQLLDDKGQYTGAMPKGDLADISVGGISFTIRLSRKSNAKILLGRKVRVMLPGAGEKEGTEAGVMGEVLAVRSLQAVENEYSVHIRFEEVLQEGLLKKIVVALRRRNK